MKKKMIAGILAFAMAASLWGCGAGGAEKDSAAENGEAGEETAERQESGEESGEDAEASEKRDDWFSEQGLTISPLGEFTFEYPVYKGEKNFSVIYDYDAVLGVESTEINIAIADTIKDGYRKEEAVLTFDLTEAAKYTGDDYSAIPQIGIFCFDRYTGNAFADCWLDIETLEAKIKENGFPEGEIASFIRGDSTWAEGRCKECRVTVLCPEEYDGVVVRVQRNTSDLYAEISDSTMYLSVEDDFFEGNSFLTDVGVKPFLSDDCVFFCAEESCGLNPEQRRQEV